MLCKWFELINVFCCCCCRRLERQYKYSFCPVVCGDDTCADAEGEDCESCPKDCGKCPLKAWQLALIGFFSLLVVVGVIAVFVVRLTCIYEHFKYNVCNITGIRTYEYNLHTIRWVSPCYPMGISLLSDGHLLVILKLPFPKTNIFCILEIICFFMNITKIKYFINTNKQRLSVFHER